MVPGDPSQCLPDGSLVQDDKFSGGSLLKLIANSGDVLGLARSIVESVL